MPEINRRLSVFVVLAAALPLLSGVLHRYGPKGVLPISLLCSALFAMAALRLHLKREEAGGEGDERQAARLLESVEEGVLSVTPEGKVSFANRAAHDLLGYGAGELRGVDVRELLHGEPPDCSACPNDKCLVLPAFSPVPAQRSENELMWRRDGSSFSADFNCTSLAGEESGGGAVFTFRDVSARRAAEERLRVQGAALEAAGNGIVIADRERRIVWVNRAFSSLTGYTPEEVLGKDAALILAGGEGDQRLARLIASLEKCEPWQGELSARREDGSVLEQEITVAPVPDRRGDVAEFVWIMLDISELRRSEEALLQSTKAQEVANRQLLRTVQRANELALEAARASAAKSEFLANMSHEIRTPMNAIIGASHLLRDTELSRQQRDYLQTLTVSADLLLETIDDVLDFSKIEAGKLEIDRVEFSVEDVVGGLLSVFGTRAEQQGLELRCELDPEIPPVLLGDPVRLTQLLNNLLGNALKFTREGFVSLSVKLARKNEAAAELLFSVRDTGIGIHADDQAQLFQPFTQVDGSITRSYGGTGLGLVICKRLAAMMKGDIWCESREGEGSTFSFWLPFAVAGAASKEGWRQRGSHAFTHFRLQRILLVEDNPFNQKVALALLERAGLRVTLACNGAEAVELVAGQEFDLVLMDVQMPVLDGLAATRAIRKLERPGAAELPILAVSANATANDVKESLAAGMNAHITKPFTPESLYGAVSTWLDRRGTLRQPQGDEKAASPAAAPLSGWVDFETGVKQTGGDRKLYHDLLRQFEREYEGIGEEIGREAASGNLQEAARLAHSVKGIAGVLAAQPLHGAAQRLETALREKGTTAESLARFEEELRLAIGSLRSHLAESGPKPEAGSAAQG